MFYHLKFISDRTASTSHGSGDNLPNFGALLSGPVIMGVGDTHVKDISSAAVTHLQPGAHVDRHGEHNYFGEGPAIHTPDGRFHQIESPFGKPKPKPETHQHGHIHATDTLTGTHSEHTPHLPEVTNLDTGAHVDFKKEHNNPYDCAVMHTPDGKRTPINCPQSKTGPLTGPGHNHHDATVLIDTHVPKLDTHQHSHIHATDKLIDTHSEHPPQLPGVTNLDTGAHVDFQFEHNNPYPCAVMHTPDGKRTPINCPKGQTDPHKAPGLQHDATAKHINVHSSNVVHEHHGRPNLDTSLPNIPGNNLDMAVVHTADSHSITLESHPGHVDPHVGPVEKHPGVAELPPGAHLDFEGQHGSTHRRPVVHLPSGKHVHLGKDKGHTMKKPIVDTGLPHIDVTHISDIDPHVGVAELPPGAHLDFEGQHGSTHRRPVVHLPSGKHVHLGKDKGHTIKKPIVDTGLPHIDVTHIGDIDPPVGVAELPPGAHLDFEGQHGSTHRRPVVHLPSGKHVHLGKDKGHTIKKPIVDTGLPHIDVTHIGDIDPHVGLPSGKHVHLGTADKHMIGNVNPGIDQDFPVDPIPKPHLKPAFPPVEGPLAHVKPDFPPVVGPLAHVKPAFPPVGGPGVHVKQEFPLTDRHPVNIKPDILPVDTIPDVFGTETIRVHHTEHIPHTDIIPEVSVPIRKANSPQTLGKIVSKQIERRRQQRIDKLQRYGSRSRGKVRGPSRHPADLPPLKPGPRVRPHKKSVLGGLVKNMFRGMYGRRGDNRKRSQVKPSHRGRGRSRPGGRGRSRFRQARRRSRFRQARRRTRFRQARPRQGRRGGGRLRRLRRDE